MLTERGMALSQKLKQQGFRIIEIYPGGAQKIWGMPRAKRDLGGLLKGLRKLGIKGLKTQISDHELDAATGALVGRLFLFGQAEIYGDFKSGAIVMPPTRT
jgi:predicted nuclease with RNAse H fold